MSTYLEAGMIVRHPEAPDWGIGQVQSVDGSRITVNFVEAGKQTLDSDIVHLVVESRDPGTLGEMQGAD